MGGIFAVASKNDCVMDLFFGTDYHSHLGTRRGGMAVYGKDGFNRAIHNIQNTPFRTKFEEDLDEMSGGLGIGCISDSEAQPLIIRSHLGNYAITTVGKIANKAELVDEILSKNNSHFLEMSGNKINATELVATLINSCGSIAEGIEYAQEKIIGSMTMLILTKDGIYAARDKFGRTPLVIGKKDDAYCASFESFAYLNLHYKHVRDLGPAEIVFMTPDNIEVLKKPQKVMKMCTFLWTYYGYTTSCYEGTNVETMRYKCGEFLADRDKDIKELDYVAGVPDSGTAHAIGYANRSGVPFARPFIKYTPTWPRSFMPAHQNMRNLIAKMKLIPIDSLIRGKNLLFIDDSIVRGTQMRETVEFLYESGAKQVHIRSASPPIMFGCKYLNFSRSTSELDLITRKTILKREGNMDAYLDEYCDRNSERHQAMIDDICRELKFTSLKYHELEDVIASTGQQACKLCTYCWNGKE